MNVVSSGVGCHALRISMVWRHGPSRCLPQATSALQPLPSTSVKPPAVTRGRGYRATATRRRLPHAVRVPYTWPHEYRRARHGGDERGLPASGGEILRAAQHARLFIGCIGIVSDSQWGLSRGTTEPHEVRRPRMASCHRGYSRYSSGQQLPDPERRIVAGAYGHVVHIHDWDWCAVDHRMASVREPHLGQYAWQLAGERGRRSARG